MTADSRIKLTKVTGRFWRIVWQDRKHIALDGVLSQEGRLHHSGQKALYVSPTPEWAGMAVDAYVRPDDPPRVLVALHVLDAATADLRDPQVCRALGITTETAGVPWQPERQAGKSATSWAASDAVRNTSADGLIYPARSYPERWHLVLHRWNVEGAAQVVETGISRRWSKT